MALLEEQGNRPKEPSWKYFIFLSGQVLCEFLKTTLLPYLQKRVIHMTSKQALI